VLYPGSHETQGIANAIANFHALLPAPLVRDAVSSEPESGGSDAGDIALIGAVGVTAVFHQAGDGVGLIPEELERSAFNAFQEFILIASEAVLCWVILKQWRPLGRRLRLRPLRLRLTLRALRRGLSALQEF
jgi:hypothetical protein